MANKYRIIPLIWILVHQYAYAAETETATNSFSIEESIGSTSSAIYADASLGIGSSSTLDLSVSRSRDDTVSLNGYGLGWSVYSERGWSSLRYQYSGEADNVEAMNLSLDLGINRESWSGSIVPRLNTVRVYSQTGPKSSSAIFSPGVSANYTYRTQNWDLGLEGGVNLYSKRLDTYTNNSRLLLLSNPLVSQMVSSLESSYMLVRASRYQSWGVLSVQALNSISAIDLSSATTVSGYVRVRLGQDWDLKMGAAQSYYQQIPTTSYSLGLSTTW